jgi:Flp pilus assembly protein TadG
MRVNRAHDERGAVALLVAAGMTALLVVAAMVLDFGLVRLDRQKVRNGVDAAVMAGLRASDDGTGKIHTQRAVCAALDFLRTNDASMSGLPTGSLDCNTAGADWLKTCNKADPFGSASAASYTGTTTSGNTTTTVTIKMPYLLTDGGYREETYSSVSGDVSELNSCDQLAVLVTRSVKPGLGSLATSSDLTSRLRGVGRVIIDGGDLVPALLLLERSTCGVLTVGSGGSPSRIKVFGSGSGPATIHADTRANGAGCGSGSNQQVFQGKQTNGVVAYGSVDGQPGQISSYATSQGVSSAVVTDGSTQVYGTTATTEAGSGTPSDVIPRDLVTRRAVDERYLGAVRLWSQAAYSEWVKNHSAPGGYTTRFGCPTSTDMTAMAAMNALSSVYIDCPDSAGITLNGTIGAGTIYFHGFIKSGKLVMPNATDVYVDNTDNAGVRINADAIKLGNGDGFCVRATACDSLAVGTCSPTGTTVRSQARLTVRRGAITTTGGLLRMCNTAVLLQGGQLGMGTPAQPGGCVPPDTMANTPPTEYEPIPPTSTPCPGATSSAGNGFLSLGGITDWTAPNRYDDMSALHMSRTQQKAAWADLEDLALWTETYGTGPAFKMAGGGALHVGGTFATFNAHPFTVTGGGAQDLTDAQFVTRSFAVDGGATLTMKAYKDAVKIPRLGPFLLVR